MFSPKKKLEDAEFNMFYSLIYREFQKIANNQDCNAIIAYSNIFAISICEGDSEEKLYWLIGDFLYGCAKEKRKLIFTASDWFDKFCEEFEKYSFIVETVNILCDFLNDILVRSKKGRKISDFGYLLWDRCIIQQLRNVKNTTLGDELLLRIIKPGNNFMIALNCLRKIVPDEENPMYYYESVYEEKALNYLHLLYKNDIIYDLSNYINQIEHIFQFEHDRMKIIFLEESYPKVNSVLEDILIKYRYSFLFPNIYNTIKTNQEEIKKIFGKLSIYSPAFVECMRDTLRSYIKTCTAKDIDELGKSNLDTINFFISFHSKVKEAESILNICFKDGKIADDIITSQCDEIKNPEYYERLAAFSDLILKTSDYFEFRNIFHDGMRFISNRDKFVKSYVKFFSKRLLDYSYNFVKEEETIRSMKEYVEVGYVRKFEKMLFDVNGCIEFNKGLNDSLVQNKITNDNSNLLYFTIILNLGAWPFSNEPMHNTIKLPPIFQKYRNIVVEQYKLLEKDRILLWQWDHGYVDISLSTDKEYYIRLNIYQYIVLEKIQYYENIDEQTIVSETGLNAYVVFEIIQTFKKLGIIIAKNNKLQINNEFSYPSLEISLQEKVYTTKSTVESAFDYLSYYKAKIVQIVKRTKEISLSVLTDQILEQHTKENEFKTKEFKNSIKELDDKGFIMIEDQCIKYVP